MKEQEWFNNSLKLKEEMRMNYFRGIHSVSLCLLMFAFLVFGSRQEARANVLLPAQDGNLWMTILDQTQYQIQFSVSNANDAGDQFNLNFNHPWSTSVTYSYSVRNSGSQYYVDSIQTSWGAYSSLPASNLWLDFAAAQGSSWTFMGDVAYTMLVGVD